MSKRFTIVTEEFILYFSGTAHKISNGECTFRLWHNKEESQKVCDKLNELNKENEQLKQENTELKSSIEKLYNKYIDEFFEHYDCTDENAREKDE